MTKQKLFIGGAAALIAATLLAGAAFADEGARAVGSTLEIHIGNDGKALVRGARVTGISGNTINAATSWGSLVVNWAVVTDGNTEFIRRYGGASQISEVSIGDYLSFMGPLDTTKTLLTVNAKTVKNWSIQKAHATFNGAVKSADSSSMSFVLTSTERGDITVHTNASTTIMEGNVNAVFSAIAVGKRIVASGLFDNQTRILDAEKIMIRKQEPAKTTFEGILKTLPGATLPTSLMLTLNGNGDVTVNLPLGTAVVGKNYLSTALSGFMVGDKIRVYGAMNASGSIDATIVRDVNR